MPITHILQTRVTQYFVDILHIQKERPEKGTWNKTKIRLEGEAITSDKFVGILEINRQQGKKASTTDCEG